MNTPILFVFSCLMSTVAFSAALGVNLVEDVSTQRMNYQTKLEAMQ